MGYNTFIGIIAVHLRIMIMNEKPLISIITPCHNSATFIHRLFDSILTQTYSRVEMIIVDNDSIDNTFDIIKCYISKFESKGYSLMYIHQEDLGPSAGINHGLKYIKGEYLLMADSDDFYGDDNLFEMMVDKFKLLPDEYAVVRCQEQSLYEEDLSRAEISGLNAVEFDSGTMFIDCLYGTNLYFYPPIGYMIKVKHLKKETNMNIYSMYNLGQNRQIFLPLYYKYKCYTIKKPLVNYLIRKNSISHGDYTKYDVMLKKYHNNYEYIHAILSRIKEMPEEERKTYEKEFLIRETQSMVLFALNYRKNGDVKKFVNELDKFGGLSLKFRLSLFKHKLILYIKRLYR